MKFALAILAFLIVQSITSLAGNDFPLTEHKSPGGINFNLFHSELQNTVAISLAFQHGFASDDSNLAGAAFLAPALMLQGAGAKSAAELYESFQDFGGSFSISGEADQTYANLSAPLKGIEGAASIANLVMTKPDFPERKFLQKKASLNDRINEALAYPETQLAQSFVRAAIEPHPYAYNYVLDSKSIASTRYSDLKPWVAQHLVRKGVLIAIVGNLDEKRAGRIVDLLLSGLPETSTLGPSPPVTFKVAQAENIKIPAGAAGQKVLMMGAMFPFNARLEDWLAGDLLNRIFVGDQKSRLFKDVREASGATYGLQGGLGYYERSQVTTVTGRIASEGSDKTLALILQSWTKFRIDGPTPVEVGDAKAAYLQYLGNLLRNHTVLASSLRDLLTGGWSAAELAKMPSLIEKANLNDKTLLAKLYPEHPIIVVTE
jgi:zinc protease